MRQPTRTLWHKAVALATVATFTAAACTETSAIDDPIGAGQVPAYDGTTSYAQPTGGAVTWNVDTGEFFFEGVLVGTVTCTDYDDPRIAGTEEELVAYLDEKCTATLPSEPPMPPDPCDPANMTFALDAEGYTIDKCEQADGSEPYWGFVVDWKPVPAGSPSFDAECWVDQTTGDGCCAYYVDIDPAELSACDVMYTPEYGYGGDTYGDAPVILADAAPGEGSPADASWGSGSGSGSGTMSFYNAGDPPGNPVPAPPPPPRPPSRATVMNWIGGALFVIGGIIQPFAPAVGKPIQDIGGRIVRQIEAARRQQGQIRRQAPRGGAVGAPPDPPPGTSREPFERGGRRPPPETTPPRPPRVLPPGGRPIPKPGQVSPQPAPRPPYRPR